MSHYAIIKPKQDHIIKTNVRQVSLKVKPNTELVTKEIHQPRATVTHSEYNRNSREEEKSVLVSENNEETYHIIQPNTRRFRGFKVECVNGKIVSKKVNNIPVNLQIIKQNKEQTEVKPMVQLHNSFEPIIKQRQQDEFMFSLQPYPNSNQAISPGLSIKNSPDIIPISQTHLINIDQQKEKSVIKSVVSNEQKINQRGFILIERVQQSEILQKEDRQEQIVSKQIVRYQIQQKHVDNNVNQVNVQSLKSPQKHRHPIFINQNAQYFEQSGIQPSSVHQNTGNIKIDHKYTPIYGIQSPQQHFNAFQSNYNGVQSKYEDKSFYLDNENKPL